MKEPKMSKGPPGSDQKFANFANSSDVRHVVLENCYSQPSPPRDPHPQSPPKKNILLLKRQRTEHPPFPALKKIEERKKRQDKLFFPFILEGKVSGGNSFQEEEKQEEGEEFLMDVDVKMSHKLYTTATFR